MILTTLKRLTVLCCAIGILSCLPHTFSAQVTFSSRHFTIQKLGNGVYAAIATNGGYAICNAGIVDLGDAALVMDPFMTPEAARDLKKAAERLTGHSVRYVINSHFHNDHTGGNQVFEKSTIISTQATLRHMREELPPELEENRKHAAEKAASFHQMNPRNMSAHERQEHIMWEAYYDGLARSVGTLKLCYPQLSFTDSMIIHGSKRDVHLYDCGPAHTEGDLLMFLPEEKILFTGDVLFIGCHPWIGDGNPGRWDHVLQNIQQGQAEVIIPGHGRSGSKDDVQPMRQYLQDLREMVQKYQREGHYPHEDNALKIPEAYAAWTLSVFYKPNLLNMWEKYGH
ncbi:MAG: MBL fold metallo-hydrolase [Saprospiraceae bacterium]